MKSFSFSLVTLGALSLVGGKPPSELHEFALSLGLSKAGIDDFVASYKPGHSTGEHQSCKTLKWLFPDDTYLPSAADAYQAKVAINWSTRAWLNSTCIFSPTTTKATAIGVKVANFFDTHFAIRSGGHSPDPGIASTSKGILFSLENLNQIKLDTTNNIASIGPGNRWGDVYENLEARGFLVTGGRVPPVGVGGLLTGGGLSYLSGTEGFAADTVKNYEVVLADGQIVNANAKQNPDLWWALKGGGNNFGIVTRFDMKAIPKPGGLVWGGILIFLPSQYQDVLKAVEKFQTEGQIADPKAAVIPTFIRAPTDNFMVAAVTIFHQDPTDTVPKSLQHFMDIGPIQDSSMNRVYSSLGADLMGPRLPPTRQLFRVLSVLVSGELYLFANNLFSQTYQPLDLTVVGVQSTLTFQPISVAMASAGDATGGHALGVPRKPHSWLCLAVSWTLEKDDQLLISTGLKFLDTVRQKAVDMGLGEDFLYLNDASSDQGIMKGYGEANLKRLREVSKKFDPKQIFQTRVTGGFKLS